MSPITKKTLTRDTSSSSAIKSVPVVGNSSVSKAKLTSVAAKHVHSLCLEQGRLPPSSPVSLPSVPDSTSDSSAPEWARTLQQQMYQHELRFEAQESRLHQLESLLQENAELKETVANQASLITELQARLLADSTPHDEPMLLDVARDLSSNASKWKDAPPTITTAASARKQSTKVVQAKPTLAQIVAISTKQPVRPKKKPVKKPLTKEQIATVARPFASNDGPTGFKYVYIGRSRRITRADTRSRFKQIGIDNSRVLDINFPAHGVIGVLVHLQYASTFEKVMSKVGAQLIKNFDPLDPKHLADPVYESYTAEARANVASSLQHNRCMNALLYLRNTRPYQVKPVGFSLVELGFISEEDVLHCASVVPQDPKNKINSDAAALFSGPSHMESEVNAATEVGGVVDGDSDSLMSVVEESADASL